MAYKRSVRVYQAERKSHLKLQSVLDGIYEIWEISGEESVTFRLTHIGGVNSMVLGFFVTGPEAVSADKLSATWGGPKSE